MSMRIWIVVAMLASGSALAAQVPQRGPCDFEVDMSMDKAQFPMIGLRFGTPMRAGVYKGWYWRAGRNTNCQISLVVAQAELGIAGAEASYGILYGRGKANRFIPLHIHAAALQTWGSTVSAAPKTLYIGVEAQVQLFYGVRVSQFWPVLGEGRSPFWGLSVVLGF